MKFHINTKGEAGECGASKGDCPFGSKEEHYDSLELARKAFEATMSGEVFTQFSNPARPDAASTAEELKASIKYFSVANDLSAIEAKVLAHKLRFDSEHSGSDEMYRGMTGFGGISDVAWSELKPGSRLSMAPRSWTNDAAVADEFSWDQSADEDDDSIKSVLIVADEGIRGVWIDKDSEFGWQNEMVATAGVFVVDRVESRDPGSPSIEDSESLRVVGHWEAVELDDDEWAKALIPHSQGTQQ